MTIYYSNRWHQVSLALYVINFCTEVLFPISLYQNNDLISLICPTVVYIVLHVTSVSSFLYVKTQLGSII